tara:strand:+ start:223 stop:996 length:774 start_codon:yes stop_codon:yes gene_type:complete
MDSSVTRSISLAVQNFEVPLENRPKHVAIIMDGNGRWATGQGLDRAIGHVAGVEALRSILITAAELQLEVLTVYSFSIENWNRPKEEVKALMDLFLSALEQELPELIENEVQLRILGVEDGLPSEVIKRMRQAEDLTKNGKGLTLCAALNYSSRREIVEASRMIAEKVKNGSLDVSKITEEVFQSHLHTNGLPDPDLLIRTAGEMRLSNYLLWQLSYSELFVTDVLWPEFKQENFLEAIRSYSNRVRRFGGIPKESS